MMAKKVLLSAQRGFRCWVLAAFLVMAWAQASPASAQDVFPPVRPNVDANGVDVASRFFAGPATHVAIGDPGGGGLTFGIPHAQVPFLHSQRLELIVFPATIGWPTSYSGYRAQFIQGISSTTYFAYSTSPNNFAPEQTNNSTLIYDSSSNTYILTDNSGIYTFVRHTISGSSNYSGRLISFVAWTGETATWHYNTSNRLQSVTNNRGYQLHFDYESSSSHVITRVTGINNAVDYCNPVADTCTYTQTWPSAAYSATGTGCALYTYPCTRTVTDELGRVTTYTFTSSDLTITRPTGGSVVVSLNSSGQVASFSNGQGTWTYSSAGSLTYHSGGAHSGLLTTTVTDPLGHTTIYGRGSLTPHLSGDDRINYVTNGVGQTTNYSYTSAGEVAEVRNPLGDYTSYSRDARGNITQVQATPTSGSPIVLYSAGYPATLTNPATDNQPLWTRDALGRQTDYVYNSMGQVTSISAPDPDGGGSLPRPVTGFGYTALNAWYKNSSGNVVQQGPAISLPTNIYQCRSSLLTIYGCTAGLSDIVITTIGYGATFETGSANNLLSTTRTVADGNGALSATTTTYYDRYSNAVRVEGPLGAADVTRFHYETGGRNLLGVIGPDPDGGGALSHRAQRYTYNADSQPIVIEQGTATNQLNLGTFAPSTRQEIEYDGQGRERLRRSIGLISGFTLDTSQTSYDAAGRVECSAVRMNPTIFSVNAPYSACTMSEQGVYGRDRITRYTYDNANRLTQITEGYGTGAPVNTQTRTYTANGQVATLADGAGHLTTYQYDGFGRLDRLRYPNPTSSGSSSTDYDQYTYNNAGDVVTERRRDGQTITYTYDNLSRVTLSDAPGSAFDVSYTYDNLGRALTQAKNGQTYSFAYDALGRLVSETQPLGAVSYQYDLAGRRTRITWPDSLYVQYVYNAAGDLTSIRENGASSGAGLLATYAYDDLGRRISTTRGNGTVETVAFDELSRLGQLAHNLNGSSADQTLDFAYNPASQIVRRTGSNASYTFAAPAAATTTYASNNLNQITTINGGPAAVYDARGNNLSHLFGTQNYDIDNNLTGLSSSVAYTFDPVGRLRDATVSGTATRFLYSGAQMIGEYNAGGSMLRRYVPGPGLDQPIVWYEGSGTTDRRWLIADERGSVIAVTNSAGNATAINTYDEYGVPGASNTGRFQYTGQAFLPEIGAYHYRARAYNPWLGRFLQTDPIGTQGGMNIYAYVGNDPINMVDPLGLFGWVTTITSCNPIYYSDGTIDTNCETRTEFEWDASDSILNPIVGLFEVASGNSPSEPSHRYTVQERLTRPNTQCSAAQVSAAVNRNIVPGNYGNHVSGGRYDVLLLGGALDLGTIRWFSNSAGTRFDNVTNDDHFLRYGSVATTITGNARSGYSAGLLGSGSNTTWEIALGNQVGGPLQFQHQLREAARELRRECGG